MRKKKILYHSNYSKLLTGFAKNARNILRYLAKTGKYEIIELSNGVASGHPTLSTLPWKALGGIPNNQEQLDKINRDPGLARNAQYGFFNIDQIIESERPDVYIGVEDIWGLSHFTKKPWWKKINSMIWTTLDSLPLLPDAVKIAPKVDNYYVWSSFAEKEMHRVGQNHVKTLHGAVDHKNFYKLDFAEKDRLRNLFEIEKDAFIIGFVFRNQLRKSVPNLLEGFRIFKDRFPNSQAKLLLHTSFSEGWNILDLAKEKSISMDDILCTYYCSNCKKYEVKPFSGERLNCRFCGSEGSQNTTNFSQGVNEVQLNEIYNLMDVYCHPFTSGGQEIPIQEAKLCELVTLCTNYSCGTDMTTKASGGFGLSWSEYREPGTQFIKASTDPKSIFKNLKKVFEMDLITKSELGSKARSFVIDNYSIEAVGKKLESIIDSMPLIKEELSLKADLRNPDYEPNPNQEDSEWVIDLYSNILKLSVDIDDEGYKHWMECIKRGMSRNDILSYFRSVALKENESIKDPIEFEDVLKNSGNKKALFCLQGDEQNLLFVSSLLESFHDLYTDTDIFFATSPKYTNLLQSNPLIYKVLEYQNEMSNENLMLKSGEDNGYFDFYFNFDGVSGDTGNFKSLNSSLFNIYESA